MEEGPQDPAMVAGAAAQSPVDLAAEPDELDVHAGRAYAAEQTAAASDDAVKPTVLAEHSCAAWQNAAVGGNAAEEMEAVVQDARVAGTLAAAAALPGADEARVARPAVAEVDQAGAWLEGLGGTAGASWDSGCRGQG